MGDGRFRYLTDASGSVGLEPTTEVEKKVVIEQQQPPNDTLGWREIATGVSSGSWAIVLVLGMAVFFLRKPAATLFEKQLALLDQLKDNLQQNAQTLKSMQETDTYSAQILKAIQERNDMVATLISDYREHNDKYHQITWDKLDRISERLIDHKKNP